MLTPKIAGELDLPPIHYSYFNPDTRRYEVAAPPTRRACTLAAGGLASGDTVARTETLLPLRARYRGAPRTPLHEHPVFWAFLALAPLPALSLRGRERRRRKTAARRSAMRRDSLRSSRRSDARARPVRSASRIHRRSRRARWLDVRELHASRCASAGASSPRRHDGGRARCRTVPSSAGRSGVLRVGNVARPTRRSAAPSCIAASTLRRWPV